MSETRGLDAVDSLIQDLRYAVRTLARSPGFALVAVLTLALGIGATTTIFSVVEGVLLRSLPFPAPGRLVQIMGSPGARPAPGSHGGNVPLSAAEVWRSDPAFDASAVYTPESAILRGTGPAQRVMAWGVSAGFFPLLGARPLLGRGFLAAEDEPASTPVAVLSHQLWVTRLGSGQDVIGKTITLDTTIYMVVGVMPANFRFPASAQVWTNLGAALTGPAGTARSRQFMFWVLARVKPGLAADRVQAGLARYARDWTADPGAGPLFAVVTPLRDFLTGPVRPPLLLMLGAVGLVLLIACANVASLVLARALARRHELGTRAALGAGRLRLMRGAITETLVVGVTGGALGLLGAVWAVPALVARAAGELPQIVDVSVDARVVAACFAASLVAGLLAGAWPAWQAARLAPAEVLRSGGEGRAAPARGRLGGALLVLQLALATVLLAGSALLLRSFSRLAHVDPGFEPGHVLVADVNLPATSYAGDAARLAYARLALQRTAGLPGVTTAALGSGIPLEGGDLYITTGRDTILTWLASVTPGYFQALGIRLLRGRTLRDADPDAVVMDSTAALAWFHGENPVGKPYVLYDKPVTVVGVVADVRQELQRGPMPHVYLSYADYPRAYLKVLLVTRGDPARSVAAVRRALQEVDPDVPVERVEPLTALMTDSLARERLYALLVVTFGMMALLLAAVGVYGLASYSVSRRTREFGVRLAFGAGQENVLRLVLGRSALLAGLGALLGLAGALAATRALRSLLFEVGPSDPGSLAGAAVVLFLVTLAASWLPARRATKVDPVVALRAE